MKPGPRVAAAFGVVLLSALWLGSAPALAGDTIKLGISLPLTGDAASYGDDLKSGMELAVSDINGRGGVLGKKLEPLFEDDAADPKQSVAVASRFLGGRTDAVINGVSRTSLAIAPLYAEENIPFLNFASTDAITAHHWDNLVRVGPKNSQEAPKLSALIASRSLGHHLAVLYSSEEYSANLGDGVLQLLRETGVTPIVVQKLSDKQEDFSALIAALKDAHIDIVYLGLWPKGAGLFLRQAAGAQYKPLFIGDFAASMDELPKIAGPSADGLIFTMTPDPRYVESAKPVVEALARRHTANHPFAIYGYLLIQIYAEAAAQAGTTEAAPFLKTLKSGTRFETIMGPVSFAANGDMKGLDFGYYMRKGGDIVPAL